MAITAMFISWQVSLENDVGNNCSRPVTNHSSIKRGGPPSRGGSEDTHTVTLPKYPEKFSYTEISINTKLSLSEDVAPYLGEPLYILVFIYFCLFTDSNIFIFNYILILIFLFLSLFYRFHHGVQGPIQSIFLFMKLTIPLNFWL